MRPRIAAAGDPDVSSFAFGIRHETHMAYADLKQRHRQERDAQPTDLRLRLHRALSWLHRAEQADDPDGRFVFLWIAFNAAYAREIGDAERLSEQQAFKDFLQQICELDTGKRIDALVWQEFSGSIRALLDNPHVFQSFWDWRNGKLSETDWEERFTAGKQRAAFALKSGRTPMLLGVVFNRIYTLRNQLMHGGATWDGATNRAQLKDCARLMEKLVPLIVETMMDNPQAEWGQAVYPVV